MAAATGTRDATRVHVEFVSSPHKPQRFRVTRLIRLEPRSSPRSGSPVEGAFAQQLARTAEAPYEHLRARRGESAPFDPRDAVLVRAAAGLGVDTRRPATTAGRNATPAPAPSKANALLHPSVCTTTAESPPPGPQSTSAREPSSPNAQLPSQAPPGAVSTAAVEVVSTDPRAHRDLTVRPARPKTLELADAKMDLSREAAERGSLLDSLITAFRVLDAQLPAASDASRKHAKLTHVAAGPSGDGQAGEQEVGGDAVRRRSTQIRPWSAASETAECAASRVSFTPDDGAAFASAASRAATPLQRANPRGRISTPTGRTAVPLALAPSPVPAVASQQPPAAAAVAASNTNSGCATPSVLKDDHAGSRPASVAGRRPTSAAATQRRSFPRATVGCVAADDAGASANPWLQFLPKQKHVSEFKAVSRALPLGKRLAVASSAASASRK